MRSGEQKWQEIAITVRPEAVESIEFALNSLDALGTATSFKRVGQNETIVVSGFFNELPDEEAIQDELHYSLKSYGFDEETILSVERRSVENQDWLAEWKKHWEPSPVGRFVIAPPWAEVEDTGKYVIRIEPNMAFGTGTHETTQLCISAIDRLYQPGMSFLDVGTGTGILAIAAAKLGKGDERIFACDTDEDSIAIARENAESNDAAQIDFEVGPIDGETPEFDFVCANLTIDVILPILDLLLRKSTQWLVLSGILAEQRGSIEEALRARDVGEFTIEAQGEWIAVIVNRANG